MATTWLFRRVSFSMCGVAPARTLSNLRATARTVVACNVNVSAGAPMSLFDAVAKLQSGLDYHLARANLLTANLAQVDTPNYKPVDLDRGGGFQAALHVAMESTNP